MPSPRPADQPLFFHIHAARQPMLLPVIMRLRKLRIPYAMTIHGRYSHLGDGGDSGKKRRLSGLYLRMSSGASWRARCSSRACRSPNAR